MKKILSILLIINCFSVFSQESYSSLSGYANTNIITGAGARITGNTLNTMLNMMFESMGVQVFDSTRVYKKDTAVVIYGKSLYRCNNNISVAGAWDASDWTQLTDTIRLWSKTSSGISSYSTLDVICNGGLEMGATSAPTGSIALLNNKGILFTNVAGPSVVEILSLNGSDEIELYNGKATLNSSGDLQTDNSLSIGASSYATTGTIRMQKNPVLSMRNKTGTGNINIIEGNYDTVEICNSNLTIIDRNRTYLFADTFLLRSQADTMIITNLASKWYFNTPDTLVLEKVKCDSIYTTKSSVWADYVFDNDYILLPFESEIDYIKSNKHLRSLQAADNRKQTTIQDTNKRLEGLVEEVEKLYLYIEKLENKIKELEK